jgi:hypothetical protein
MKALCVLMLASAALHAQITSMSTDYSGSALYFTANLAQAGSTEPSYGKLFIADDNGIRLLVARAREETPVYVFRWGFVTNYYDLIGVDVASNGSRISLTGFHECSGISTIACSFMDGSDIYDDQGRSMFSANGYVSFSPNGAWGLEVAMNSGPFPRLTLIEVASGIRHSISFSQAYRYWRLHKVANDGTVALVSTGNLSMFRPPDAVQRIPTGMWPRWAAIDAQPSTVIWQEGSYLSVWKVDAPLPAKSLQVPGRIDFAPRISDDGSRILFLSRPEAENDPQIFTMRADGTGRRQISAIQEGVASSILSGNGAVAWAVTRTGRLLKIDVASGTQQQLIGPVAAFCYPTHLSGGYLGERLSGAPGEVFSAAASVMPGEQVRVQIGSEPAQVTDVGVQKVSFLVPATLAVGSRHEVSISKSGDSRWTSKPMTLEISQRTVTGSSCGSEESIRP